MANLQLENRWLRDPASRAKALRIAAASSSAVEGIRKPYVGGAGSELSPMSDLLTPITSATGNQ